jgi:hypothetical protein
MVVIMNSGAVLRNIQIVFDKNLGAGLPPIKRAVEVESGGTRYYAAFDRLQGRHVTGRSASRAWNEPIMKAATHIPRCVGIVALAVVFAFSGLGASKKSRVFNAQFEAVWTAATEVAQDAFLADKISKGEGRLRFRSGPFRGYRFEVVIVDAGAGKTRVELDLRTNLRGIEKDAWRNGDRYLTLIAQRLQRGGGE